MKRSTIAISMMAAVTLATGCKKKAAEDKPAPPTAGTGSGTTAGTGSGTAAGTATPTPTQLTGEALAKAYLASWDAWNAGDKARFRATYADDAISHWPDSPMPERKGGDAIAEQAMGFRAGFPDAKATAQLILVNGRTVTGVWLTTGTNSAAMKTPEWARCRRPTRRWACCCSTRCPTTTPTRSARTGSSWTATPWPTSSACRRCQAGR